MEKELTIIIITYNSKEVIGQCLENINSDKFDIFVVDNASTDGTADFIINKFPNVKIINSEKNQGYGRAANIGLKAAKTRYSLLMNPDVITSSEDILNLLSKTKLFPEAVIAAPSTREDKAEVTSETPEERLEWVSGAAMLLNMNLLSKVGFFDENIFLFYEETDLCKRAVKAGYEIILFKYIKMKHLVGKSSTADDKITYLKYWHMAWSRFYFNKKYSSYPEYYRKTVGYLLKFTIKYLMYILSGNKEKKIKYKASLAGSTSFLKGVTAFDGNNNPIGIKL